jgi:hypothetical protein
VVEITWSPPDIFGGPDVWVAAFPFNNCIFFMIVDVAADNRGCIYSDFVNFKNY